jgi:arsenate reductase-like glutaredoxin family protein
MNFTVYTKENCPHCYKIKQVLELTGTQFVSYNLEEDFTREEFHNSYPIILKRTLHEKNSMLNLVGVLLFRR